MNAPLPPMKPREIGRAMRDGRAYKRDLVNGPARHLRIGTDWERVIDLACKAVIAALAIVAAYITVTQ